MKLSFDLGVQRTTSEHTPHTVGVTSPPFGAGWPSENRDFFWNQRLTQRPPKGQNSASSEQYPSISNIIKIYQHHMAYVYQIYLLQQSNGPLAVLWVFPPTIMGSWWFIFLSDLSCPPPGWHPRFWPVSRHQLFHREAISVPSSSPIILARRIWTTLGLWCISISSDLRRWRRKSHPITSPYLLKTPPFGPPKWIGFSWIFQPVPFVNGFPSGRSFWGCNPVLTNPREIIKFPHSYLIVSPLEISIFLV